MSALLLILLGAAAGYAIDDDNRSEDPARNGEVVRVDDGLIDTGTDGDDIIDLASLFEDPGLLMSDISGGSGDDQIIAQGELNNVEGGDGDDTIAVVGFDNTISGGAGDDLIRAINGSSDPTDVDGGSGNDTIDISGSENVRAVGGEGDDLLVSDGRTFVGTGFVISSDGGAGDDTLSHSVDVFPIPSQDPAEAAAVLVGGEGADTFDISLTTGNGSFSESDDDPEVFNNNAAIVSDFEQGTDILTVEIPSSLIGYSVETGTLSEDATAGLTFINLELTSDSLPTQDVRIIVGATGLSWSDVTFTDQAPTTLAVA